MNLNADARLLLETARDVLLAGDTWTQSASAKTPSGKETQIESPNAYQFCAIGALIAANNFNRECLGYIEATDVLDEIAGQDIIDFNNAKGRTAEEVIAIFNRALGDA
jgi:hypothetical protein